jgi:hypothetical protein
MHLVSWDDARTSSSKVIFSRNSVTIGLTVRGRLCNCSDHRDNRQRTTPSRLTATVEALLH